MAAGCTDADTADGVAVLGGSRTAAALGAALPEGAGRTGCLACSSGEARWAAALPGDVVTGCSGGTGTAFSTALPKRSGQAGFLAAPAPPSRGALAGAGDGVAQPFVPTVTALLAARPKVPLWTGALTAAPTPPRWALALSLWVADPPIQAGAALPAAVPVPLSARQLTGQPSPSHWAGTVPRGGVACPPVLAQAMLVAACPIEPLWACLLACGSHPASSAQTAASDVVTRGIVGAAAHLAAALTKPALWARMGAAGPSPAWVAVALPSDVVTVGSILAVAGMLTLNAIKSIRAGVLTEGPPPALSTCACPTDVVTRSPVLTLAAAPAAQPEPSCRATLLAAAARVAGIAGALPRHRIAAPGAAAALADVGTARTPTPHSTASPAVVTRPAGCAAARPRHRVAMALIPTAAALLAVLAKPAGWAHILAAAASEARWAHARSRGGVTAAVVGTLRTQLLAAEAPATLWAGLGAVVPCPSWCTHAPPADCIAGSPAAGAEQQAAGPEPPCWALLVAVLPMVALGTLLPAPPGDVVTPCIRRAAALLLAALPIAAGLTLGLAVHTAVARLAAAGAVPLVAVLCVGLHTEALLRAAGAERPLGTRQVAVPAVQARIAQTRSVDPMAATSVGTVAFLPALLSKKPFRAPILTVDPSHARGAAAGAGGGLTGTPILAEAELAAVLAEGSRRAGLVAQQPAPAGRALTARPLHIACAPILTVLTCQAAVGAKGVLQTDECFRQGVLPSCFHLFLLLFVVIAEELGELILQDGHMGNGADNGAPGIQGFH